MNSKAFEEEEARELARRLAREGEAEAMAHRVYRAERMLRAIEKLRGQPLDKAVQKENAKETRT